MNRENNRFGNLTVYQNIIEISIYICNLSK